MRIPNKMFQILLLVCILGFNNLYLNTTSAVDVDPPKLNWVDFDRSTVNIGENVFIQASLSDNGTGVNYGYAETTNLIHFLHLLHS